MTFSWDYDAPLVRVKGETSKASQALWDYAQMGAGRSLAKLIEAYQSDPEGTPDPAREAQPPTTRLRTLKAWSVRYDWQARVARWDQLQKEAEAGQWEERREAFRQRAYDIADQALERLEDMLTYPLTRRVVLEKDDQGRDLVVQVEPVRWDMKAVAQLLREANKAGRLALGEPTETTEQRHSGAIEAAPLGYLEDAELNDKIEQLLDRLDAPGPGEISEPAFREGPAPEASGDQPPEGA